MAQTGMKVRTVAEWKKVMAASRQGTFKSLGHAGSTIRKQAQRSIKRSPKPSEPGSPPHTRKGALKNAILYAMAANKLSVVIGPDYSKLGNVGMAHEFGGHYRRESFHQRPFMGPALTSVQDRLPALWAGSVR